mmetsp:Transcript_62146/g.85838  ORF Transcript_62146/g.85838 Transcript_62146/m.85838 type:complete len:497 (-) Transcript_62146:300-1790(-)
MTLNSALIRQLSDEQPGTKLGGNSEEVVDIFAWTALGVVCGAGLLFYAGREVRRRLSKAADIDGDDHRTPSWVFVSFLTCYGLLIPGLFCTLFSYDLSGLSGTVPLRNKTESMISFVGELWENEAYLGSILVVLYAMVIPVAKLALLALSEVWRRGTPKQVARARMMVQLLQRISKWASPDMFAYVLFLYLIRTLDHPPTMLAAAELDIGFSCFSVFCVGSTVASLGLRVPPVPEGCKEPKSSCCTRIPPARLVAFVALLCAIFVPLLLVGLQRPSMSLRVNPDGFFLPNGPLDPALRPIVASMGIEELAQAEVSVWNCLEKLTVWTGTGEANAFIGFVLFAVGVLAATVLNMAMLLAASVIMWYRAAETATLSKDREPTMPACPTEQLPVLPVTLARVLKKLSFLDVAIVGVLVIVAGGQAYRIQGLILSLEAGLIPLIMAESCHYLAYHLVTTAASPSCAARSIKLAQSKSAEEQEGPEVASNLPVEPEPQLGV